MEPRKKRQVIVASIVAASLLVVAIIGTTAFFVIRTQQRSDDVDEAARVATTYNKAVSDYRSSVESALTGSPASDARKIRTAFKAAVVKTPKLGDAPEWGRTHSTSYIKAEKSEKSLTAPYKEVTVVLDEAVVGQPFIKAAESALDFRINDFIGKSKYFYNGAPFRDKLVPGMEKILKKFDKVKVPKGREPVAGKVRDALKGIIKDAKQAAADLDAGRNTSVNATAEYLAASTAVSSYESSLRTRLESAIQDVAATVSGQSST